MTVIDPADYGSFWRSLPKEQQSLAQGYFGKMGRTLKNLTVTVEQLDGPGTTPPYDVRLTAAEIRGEAIVSQTTVMSTLELSF